jgi:hypothetical protein
MDEGKTNEVVKPRKRKAAARWAMLEQVPPSELSESQITDDVLYRIAVDNCKSEKAVKVVAETEKIDGAVMLVCIHETGAARPETKTLFNWKK